ncbi:MAG: hypothetical protein K2Q06_15305 [Parvularculaceae bacterium]|nr:hypothetical protein [Parvularculaceae bacterium]
MSASFGPLVPVLRIFDETRAREFYVGYLGFAVEFEHRFGENFPLYLSVQRGALELHLSEHSGDGSPGANVRIKTVDLAAFVAELRQKDYRYAKPGCAQQDAASGDLELTLTDPFGNRLTFWEDAPESSA